MNFSISRAVPGNTAPDSDSRVSSETTVVSVLSASVSLPNYKLRL